MRKAKNLSIFTAIILLFSTFFTSMPVKAAFTPGFALYSEGVYMVNLDTDIVIVSKNADKRLCPASTTKIMTCLVALANIKNFDAYCEVPYECFNEFSEGNPNYTGPSNADISPRQTNITYWDALYSMMLASACESSNILAYNIGGGSMEHFYEMMNDMAKQIGCKNTHFSNSHGLYSEDNYTTAYDLYLITKYAIENYPGFMKICGTLSYEMPPNDRNPDGYYISHTCQLMNPNSQYYVEGASGVKTGSIDRIYKRKGDGWDYDNVEYGSRVLVTTAMRDGYTYMIVSLGAPYFNEDGTATETQRSFTDHVNLYNWAFSEFEYTLVIGKNEQIMQVEVDKGLNADTVGVVATEDYYTLLPKSLDMTTIQQLRPVVEMMEAPIKKGTDVGQLELRLNDETLAKLKLVTEAEVELDMVAFYSEKLKNILTSPQFIMIVIVLVLLIVLYAVARTIRRNYFRKQAEMQRRRKIQMAPPNGRKPQNRYGQPPRGGPNRPSSYNRPRRK